MLFCLHVSHLSLLLLPIIFMINVDPYWWIGVGLKCGSLSLSVFFVFVMVCISNHMLLKELKFYASDLWKVCDHISLLKRFLTLTCILRAHTSKTCTWTTIILIHATDRHDHYHQLQMNHGIADCECDTDTVRPTCQGLATADISTLADLYEKLFTSFY